MKATALLAWLLALSAVACATTGTSTTTWQADGGNPAWVRPGRVEAVQETVRRTQGEPVGGALAGALIGGFLFGGRGPGALIGAAGGAVVGAAASQGSVESLTYQVLVHFDDGTFGWFVYRDYSPFRPGDLVVGTPQGLARR